MHIDAGIRARLLAMRDDDLRVRSQLEAAGALYAGYHPEMQRVHEANAVELDRILQGAWPSLDAAGQECQDAAWLIVQHAIGQPDFQRRYLKAIASAVKRGHAPGWQAAMLEDRIRCFEGRLQLYGTQFDWDDHGDMSPLPIEQPETVDARRAAAGLEPLSSAIQRHRAAAGHAGARSPIDLAVRNAEFLAWARKVGWRQ